MDRGFTVFKGTLCLTFSCSIRYTGTGNILSEYLTAL